MYIILGATGHIGSALLRLLVKEGLEVTGITSNNKHVSRIEKTGAKAAVADVRDTGRLVEIFKQGKRLYFLNPPAPPNTDISKEEQKNVDSVIDAINQVSFEKIVAESTYGAQPGNEIADLGVLYNMEQQLKSIQPATIIRGAYYYSNWDHMLDIARSEGKIYSLFPEEFTLPMVAPADIAAVAAKALQAPADDDRLIYIEGPQRYTPTDVATTFGHALKKDIAIEVISKSNWIDHLMKAGFSKNAAHSMANMTNLTLEKPELPASPEKGKITLEEYISELAMGNEQ